MHALAVAHDRRPFCLLLGSLGYFEAGAGLREGFDMNTQDKPLPHQPVIHVRDNHDGTMTARQMHVTEANPSTYFTRSYLSAAELYLAGKWPGLLYKKTGWSANASEAIYHFAATPATIN